MKVLISGGGIAGNALAFWLSKLGHDVTVIERFPSLRVTGLQIDLRGHGIEVMKRMGLEQAFRSKQAPEQGLQVIDGKGRRWAYFPANKSGDGLQSFTSDFEIMRGDLCRIMYSAATKHGAKYVFGISITNFEEKQNSVEVHFTNGNTENFDLVVGADGVRSRTRKIMLGSDAPDAFHPIGNIYVAYFTVRQPIQKDEEYIATSYTAPGRRAIMTRRHSPDEIQVYLGLNSDSERLKNARPGDVKEEKAALAEIFQGAGWRADEILASLLTDSQDFYCERMGLVKLDSWSQGSRVTLVGDAAYCPSATTGMGTTCGIVGAYILAGEIGRYCNIHKNDKDKASDLATALEAYEQKFRPFIDQVTQGVSEATWNALPSTSFGIAVMNCILGVASLLRLDIIGKWFLRENVKDWDLPDYEEMLQL